MKIRIHIKYKPIINNLKTTKLNLNNVNKNVKFIAFNLPINLSYKLTQIKGINIRTSNYLIIKQGYTPYISQINLNKYKLLFLTNLNTRISKEKLQIGPIIKKIRVLNILKLKKNSSYRGLRHYLNLPVRGQRTCSNAKTRKKFKIC